jgi:lantibiotic transport system permease protein
MTDMKDKDEFLKQMENLQVPDINPREHPKMVKMAIMNAERSAVLGVWLIVVPGYFLFCVLMYYYFHLRVHVSWFAAMYTLMASLDKTPYIDFLAPIVLFVLPTVAIIINALAIIHVGYEKPYPDQPKARQFNITIKIKLYNIALILISMLIIGIFISYVMTTNISVNN